MLSLKCKNCGGELSIDSSGSLYCEFCGSSWHFSDSELGGYKEFRRLMLNYVRHAADLKKDGGDGAEDALWSSAERVELKTAEGMDICLDYLYSYDDGICMLYLCRRNFLLVFPKDKRNYADKWHEALRLLEYPPADVRDLKQCFPIFLGRYELANGGLMISCERPANVFPLDFFGALTPEHAAWVVSRMENICCVLEYSGIRHGGISAKSMFINPFTHHGMLIGGWYGAVRKKDSGMGDLKDVRSTAEFIMGLNKERAPKAFLDFIGGVPAKDAYSDFELWDNVIHVGFGGRRFVKMDLNT